MQKNSKASILIFTLIFLSMLAILTEQLVKSVLINYFFTSNQIKMHQARSLALGGINLAISQLIDEVKDKLQENNKEKEQKDKFKIFLQRILPNLNKKQIFKLTQDVDGINGEVGFCISCENGKLNINKIFDFEKKEFKENYKELLAGLEIKGKLKPGDILKNLTDFLNERKKNLNDISELIKIQGLSNIDLFYKPPAKNDNNKKNKKNLNADICLQDLFTTWTDDENIEFLFLSNSTLAVLGLRQPMSDDAVTFEKQFKNLIEFVTKNYSQNIIENWSYYSPIFGKDNKILNGFKSILSKEFGPKVYSVISYGKIDEVEQRLLVVLKEVEKQKKEKETESSLKTFQIVRMYWI
ncbi:general secretion pathway protein GspK [Candidatus Dependentiae bacterium]|nr:general secretion pathway protein GspK [Candidatus Dependentiae bacterium]MBU4387442.1 general secretion pathway protein GspK [Candidatus Dependentiae bacterium]MCG2756020.1 type II secretion system protein GspK [Candidatus Dependentiae bacterium]